MESAVQEQDKRKENVTHPNPTVEEDSPIGAFQHVQDYFHSKEVDSYTSYPPLEAYPVDFADFVTSYRCGEIPNLTSSTCLSVKSEDIPHNSGGWRPRFVTIVMSHLSKHSSSTKVSAAGWAENKVDFLESVKSRFS